MRASTWIVSTAGAAALAGCLATTPKQAADADPLVALYRLDCGRIQVSDANMFNDDGAYPGETLDLVDSCYLVRHGDDWLLWDSGLPDSLAAGDPVVNGAFTVSVATTLAAQIEALGLTPSDIDYFGLSHSHFDHTANAPLVGGATLVIQQAEFDWIWAEGGNVQAREAMAPWTDGANVMALDGDADLFGDGTVEIISLPGHTPGHQALQVNLADAGPVILSGDQYHFDANREHRGVPVFNTDRDATLASHDKLEARIAETGARFVIQHEPGDVPELPAFPEALD